MEVLRGNSPIPHSNGKSLVSGGFNTNITYKCSIFQPAMFDETRGKNSPNCARSKAPGGLEKCFGGWMLGRLLGGPPPGKVCDIGEAADTEEVHRALDPKRNDGGPNKMGQNHGRFSLPSLHGFMAATSTYVSRKTLISP